VKLAIATAAEREAKTCALSPAQAGRLCRQLRLHLQTERFLARLRCDGLWETGCDRALAKLETVKRPHYSRRARLAAARMTSVKVALRRRIAELRVRFRDGERQTVSRPRCSNRPRFRPARRRSMRPVGCRVEKGASL
jgi:hypothetical protein